MEEMPGMIRPDLQALFPACAGVIPIVTHPAVPPLAFPHLCGGDPILTALPTPVALFSPPVRG